jgi:hypothetical protein
MNKQETLEEAYLNQLIDEANKEFTLDKKLAKDVAIKYAKWQQDNNKYSEEDMKESFISGALTDLFNTWDISDKDMAKEKFDVWFENFKKK